jgi:two-component system NarL family sensor kinase
MQSAQTLGRTRALRVEVARLAVPSLAAGLLLLAAAFVALRLASPTDGAVGDYVTSSWSADGLQVTTLPGESGGLQSGDIVTAINGRSLSDWMAGTLDSALPRPQLRPGATLDYRVLRGDATVSVTAPLRTYPITEVLLANWSTLLWALSLAAVGSYLYVRRPREPATRALMLFGVGVMASTVPWMIGLGPADLVAGGAGPLLYLLATFPIYLLFWSASLHFSLVFPRPIAADPLQGRLVRLAYLVPLSAQLAWMLGALPGSANALAWVGGWTVAQLLIVPGVILASLGALVFQWRRASAEDRNRLRWILRAAVVGIVGVLLGWFLPESLTGRPLLPWNAIGVAGMAFPFAIGLAVGQHGLFGIETLLHRSLVYGGLTAGVLAVYAAAFGVLGILLPGSGSGDGPYAVTLLAIGAAALVAVPLRDRLQKSVSHLLYGDRDEPYLVIARLGERLEASLEPGTVLPMVAETVAEALRLPYAAIELRRNGGTVVVAAHGTPRGELERLPMVHHGEEIGFLTLAPRDPDTPFSAPDRALLADLARQAAAAAHSVRLTADLQRSRQQLVTAREEERRRLRRDLHDGVGPALAGSLMKLEAARSTAPGGPALDRLLSELSEQTRRAIDDIRRVASDLRPPALDQLGLVEALDQDARRLCPRDCTFRMEVAGPLPALPAAVEVAAYRIGLEALTNVAHHAGARHAILALQVADDHLVVEVRDDGHGMRRGERQGIGFTSMRERADELGGDLEVGSASEGGLRVTARLPLSSGIGHA